MKIKTFLLTLLLALPCSFWAQSVSVIPLPQKVEQQGNTQHLVLQSPLRIHIDKLLGKRAKEAVKEWMKQTSLQEKRSGFNKAQVQFVYNKNIQPEGYVLEVKNAPERIVVSASDAAGVFYALQTLAQVGKVENNAFAVHSPAKIEDYPRFAWRGFMLDEGRHFFGKQEVKRILDIMARYKMNRFHWHLTEDQGWRIQIKKYPKLTEVGAWRTSKTLPWGGVKADTLHYGGYYTQKDIREIVKYAKDRFIEIVPEIDMPGHFQAAIAAYPELLACDPEKPHHVWVGQGVSTDVMNVASPKAMKFTKDLLDELIRLFPYKYIHLGGDECPTTKWQQTPECQALLKELGSKNYQDLQTHFYGQLNDYLHSKSPKDKRKLIFWNEVLWGNTSKLKDVTIMSWVGADQSAKEAAQRGFNTILTPQIPYYINRKQSKDANEPHSQGPGTENLKSVYAYQPAANVASDLLKHYLGVQANFWTEWVDDNGVLEYLLLPRLAAVAEAGWTNQDLRHYDNFLQRVKNELPYYKANGYEYGAEAFGMPGRKVKQ